MYFPYLRGRQYELLAIKELVSQKLLNKNLVVPLVEPVRLSPTLVSVMSTCIEKDYPLAIVGNPSVGSFCSDCSDLAGKPHKANYKAQFDEKFYQSQIIKSLIVNQSSISILDDWQKKGIKKSEILAINLNRDCLDIYASAFNGCNPLYTLLPDEGAFKRRITERRVLLDDKFEKQDRNSDYQYKMDEFFSEDHLFFRDEGFIGFSDYSIVGNEYSESGFAPYAVAIHIVYLNSDNELRVRHFVSDSNEDISNPAKKFYEAASKLATWYDAQNTKDNFTKGLEIFLKHHREHTYPGLGTVKKLSIMHHLELMNNYLKR